MTEMDTPQFTSTVAETVINVAPEPLELGASAAPLKRRMALSKSSSDLSKKKSPRSAILLWLPALLQERVGYAWDHVQKERMLFKEHYKTIVVCLFMQYVHAVATRVAYLLHSPRDTLFDLGFAMLPALSKKVQIVSELLFFFFIISIVIFAFSPFVMRQRRGIYTTLMFSRFGAVVMLCQALRCVCFLVTSLPGPNFHCRPNAPDYNPPTTAVEIFWKAEAFFGCGDLVFSSHTIFVVAAALSYQRYGGLRWVKRIMWCLVFLFGLLVIAARKHYTLDIFIAWYTVPLVWIAYDKYFPDRIPADLLEMEDRDCDDEEISKDKH